MPHLWAAFRPFSTGRDEESAADASPQDFKTLEEKMNSMEQEIEASAKANREFVDLDGVNLYDELKEEQREDQTDQEKTATAVKNMSLKLLACTQPEEVLKIFEDEFLHGDAQGKTRSPTGEELALVLKFL
jgi:hypothetical protein